MFLFLAWKSRFFVTYNGDWHPMKSNDFLNKNLNYRPCNIEGLSKMKCPYLLNLSTTTSTASKPLDLGRPTIKCIMISSHVTVEMGNGCTNLVVNEAWYLLLWHTWQVTIYSVIVSLMSTQKNWPCHSSMGSVNTWKSINVPLWKLYKIHGEI